MNEKSLINVLDNIDEALIAIDSDGIINMFNKKAQEMFGAINTSIMEHEAGQIKKGDIVLIADTSMGEDDGHLEKKDLESIGVYSEMIKEGDAVIAYGRYLVEQSNGFYTIREKYNKNSILEAESTVVDYQIKSMINFIEKYIVIEVDGVAYRYDYKKALGHMVIISSETNKVKFFQGGGYTTRGESVKEILRGKVYEEKNNKCEVKRLEGKSIFEVFPRESNETITELLEDARGNVLHYVKELKIINGLPTRCTVVHLCEEDEKYTMLKIEDITELTLLKDERDNALASLEEARQQIILDEMDNFIGQSMAIKNVKALARKASATASNVLILGESGIGKGLLAKLIHQNSKRAKSPFIHVNCASIPENLIESELFGYEGGSFTGAKKEGRKGYFELAENGTIFLDEIGELPLHMQAKLLHVLQDRNFMKVGGSGYIEVNARVITATNRELVKEVEEGRFRKDLYYRINVFPIYVPPLRMRREDIYLLTYKLLPKICKKLDIAEKTISAESLALLESYEWPGNVRELENILEMAVNMADGNLISKEHINITDRGQNFISSASTLKSDKEISEKRSIVNALSLANGDKREAMKFLGIKKSSFYSKLQKYGIK